MFPFQVTNGFKELRRANPAFPHGCQQLGLKPASIHKATLAVTLVIPMGRGAEPVVVVLVAQHYYGKLARRYILLREPLTEVAVKGLAWAADLGEAAVFNKRWLKQGVLKLDK